MSEAPKPADAANDAANEPASDAKPNEWFARDGEREPGLRFSCTSCGACCSGPEGFVMVSDEETKRLANRMGVSIDKFVAVFTRPERGGRSLVELKTEHGHDCVFLDRERVPGRAICRVYEDRPQQCRTWPFWKQNLRRARDWESSAQRCPGMNEGPLIPPERVRVIRDASPL
ncbi:MAG: YkgJ family cysteine cluster protein [Planctomycetota bacterium]